MLIAGIPKPQSKFVKISYYLMRFMGPLLIFFLSFIVALYFISITFYPLYQASTNSLNRNFYFIFMSFLMFPSIMVVISLGYTIFGDIGTTRESIRRFKDKNTFITQYFLDSLPRCHKCGLPKPPRAHHCSTCGCCHLKMDHHCPSIGTCIALWNQQPFIVMLQWSSIEILFFILASLYYSLITQSKEEKVFSILFSLLLVISLFVLIYFKNSVMKRVTNNTTLIEEMKGELRKYNLGYDENVNQVFGSGTFRFYIPKRTAMTGFEWALDEYCCKMPENKNNSEYAFFPRV